MADRHKTPTLSIRPTAAQRAVILERAVASGMSVNKYLLTVALANHELAPPPPPRVRAIDPATLATLQGLRAEVGKLGNVVNQLAHAAHLGPIDGASYGPKLVSRIHDLSDSILTALGRDGSRGGGR